MPVKYRPKKRRPITFCKYNQRNSGCCVVEMFCSGGLGLIGVGWWWVVFVMFVVLRVVIYVVECVVSWCCGVVYVVGMVGGVCGVACGDLCC